MHKNFSEALDFIDDDSFISWVLKTDDHQVAIWDQWIADNPDKKTLVDEAASMVKMMQFKEPAIPAHQFAAAEARLFDSIRSEKGQDASKLVSMKFKKIWYAAAAVLLIGVLAISMQFLSGDTVTPKPQFSTAYGQIRQDKLPDGTEVTLNANSKIIYPKQWEEGTDREVWIDGEAFFHVKKTSRHNRFIVHTDAFDIEVTGTSFNVVNRNGVSTVILKEGSVKIHRPGVPELLMVPGDQVEFSNQQIQKKAIVKTDYLAWTENKLVFDSTSIGEVANIIKEHYGVEVKLQGFDTNDKDISGVMPNDNLAVLLSSLEEVLDAEIIRTKNLITIINKNQ